MTPNSPRRGPTRPVLLVAAAFGVWLFLVGTYVAALPDRVASADQAERLIWAGD